MNRRFNLLLALLTFVGGCAMAPTERLTFPAAPFSRIGRTQWFDVNGDGKADFALAKGEDGRVENLLYDDDEDGEPDRSYAMKAVADDVPHVVILLDSIPFQLVNERCGAGDFAFLRAPRKVIAPFPSLTEVCYTEVLHAPPLPTVIDTQYDPRQGGHRSDLWKRVVDDYRQPWERRLTYGLSYADTGLTFLDPQKWYAAELARAKHAIDDSPRRTTVVYLASAAAMVCKFGRAGANEVLDGARQLCLQLLYERRGAIRISLMADHGHNFVTSKNIDLAAMLTKDGFCVTDKPSSPDDVTISINGLVTNALLQTARPAKVAEALVRNEAVELAAYVDGADMIVVGKGGRAVVSSVDGRHFAYRPVGGDPLRYQGLEFQSAIDTKTLTLALPRSTGRGDQVGMTEPEWLAATADHEWPNAPARLWHAFHRQTVQPPSVMLSLKDGYYCGKPGYETFITMRSTHGGLNQANSATFVMSTFDTPPGPWLPRDVMKHLMPDGPPAVVR